MAPNVGHCIMFFFILQVLRYGECFEIVFFLWPNFWDKLDDDQQNLTLKLYICMYIEKSPAKNKWESHNCEVFYIPERFFQSNVITSDAAMDTGSVAPVEDDIAPDKPAPDLRSPWSTHASGTSVPPDDSDATVLRWTPAPLPHWRPVTHRTV